MKSKDGPKQKTLFDMQPRNGIAALKRENTNSKTNASSDLPPVSETQAASPEASPEPWMNESPAVLEL